MRPFRKREQRYSHKSRSRPRRHLLLSKLVSRDPNSSQRRAIDGRRNEVLVGRFVALFQWGNVSGSEMTTSSGVRRSVEGRSVEESSVRDGRVRLRGPWGECFQVSFWKGARGAVRPVAAYIGVECSC